jgi:protein-tyrosine phosphatase
MKVLFVCMGNICRSPTAEGVFRQHVMDSGLQDRVKVDSAGTHNYHPDQAPDPRAIQVAAMRGYDLTPIRARQIQDSDFEKFDLILVMDWDNLSLTQSQSPPQHQSKVRRFAEFSSDASIQVVPDPFFGDIGGFEHVLDLVEDCSAGLLKFVTAHQHEYTSIQR